MSSLEKLRGARSLSDFAKIIHYSPKGLSYVLYKKKRYSCFEIPKKGGGFRYIQAPEKELKKLQIHLANYLMLCCKEIDKDRKKKYLSHGFRKGYSIHTNAKIHRNRRYVLNFDIKGFFPSINFGRVRGYFIANNDFKLHKNIATIIAQIACHDNQLPQGSPCSPVISNFIGHLLDIRMVRIAKVYKCTYSRYVDDITFSTNQKIFPENIAIQNSNDSKDWVLSETIKRQVFHCGFEVHPNKTRMNYKQSRQTVTGLVVNNKVNVRSEYYKYTRAMVYSFCKTGTYTIPALWIAQNSLENASKSLEFNVNRLGGILNHIHYTRILSNQTNQRMENKKQNKKSKGCKEDYLTATEKLLKIFLFFKNFGLSNKPVIVCEGKTDPLYIKSAFKKFSGTVSIQSLQPLKGAKLVIKSIF